MIGLSSSPRKKTDVGVEEPSEAGTNKRLSPVTGILGVSDAETCRLSCHGVALRVRERSGREGLVKRSRYHRGEISIASKGNTLESFFRGTEEILTCPAGSPLRRKF